MEELHKEIKASDGSPDVETEKDVIYGSKKRKYTETQSVKIAKFGQPLKKHAKIESSSKEDQAQEEVEEEAQEEEEQKQKQVGYFEIDLLYERTCHLLRYDIDVNYYSNSYDTFLKEAERQKNNQMKVSQDEISDDDEDLWSSEEEDSEKEEEEEEEIQSDQIDEKDEEKDEDDDDETEEEDGETEDDDENDDEVEEDEEEHDEEREEKEDEGIYDRCLYGTCKSCTEYELACDARSKAKKELSELVLRRPDIKDGSSAQQVYRRLKEANLTSTMDKAKAMTLINFAIRYYSKDKSRQLSKRMKKLIYSVPCITIDHYYDCTIPVIGDAKDARDCFLNIVYGVERIFHPLIRKKNIKEMVWLSKRNTKARHRKKIQQCMAVTHQIDLYALIKHREERISLEALQDAFPIVQLHQDFDCHLASSSFLNEKSKIAELMSDDNVVTTRFKELDSSLIKASLRWRVRLLKKRSEYKRYVVWLRPIVELKEKKGHTILDSVLEAVRKVHPDFPNLSEECILDQKPEEFSSFCELLSEIKRYLNCPVSHRYLVDGIVVYLKFCSDLEKTKTETEKRDVFAKLQYCFRGRLDALEKVWGTRHYEHPAYNTLFGP